VLRSVDASQQLTATVEAGLAAQRFADTPGNNPLFNDFDPLTHLSHAANHAAARPAAQPDAHRDGRPGAAPQGEATSHAPSFTRQLQQAAGAARPPGASTPARTSTPRQ
jgi:hypothetical protein